MKRHRGASQRRPVWAELYVTAWSPHLPGPGTGTAAPLRRPRPGRPRSPRRPGWPRRRRLGELDEIVTVLGENLGARSNFKLNIVFRDSVIIMIIICAAGPAARGRARTTVAAPRRLGPVTVTVTARCTGAPAAARQWLLTARRGG